jgi:uncharacterized SAM-binding protein YcdF (DUF218 family)
MIALEQEAAAANVLTDYLAKRDIPALTADALQMKYGIAAVDVLILFGGAIPFGCDVAARACQAGLANKLLLVGGVGHTTRALQKAFAKRFPKMLTEGRAEAELMAEYLSCSYGMQDCSIEKKSTNCGNNVTYALAKLRELGCAAKTLLILQDASMQRRMDATFQAVLEAGEKIIINYAPYRPEILARDGNLVFRQRYWGLWDMERYLTLLMGEIPRLRDDENGYGPKGKKFLAHVDIPEAVEMAFEVLQQSEHGTVRAVDEIYKS